MIPLNPILAGLAIALPGLPTPAAAETSGLYIAHADHILGTSFDLKINATAYSAAVLAEATIRTEIDRLTQTLSSYRPDSEFSRWLAAPVGEAVAVSSDLFAVLTSFDQWRTQTNGALNAAAERINQLWQQAAQSGMIPSDADRAQAVADVGQTHWQLDATNQTATRLTQTPLQLHTFAKSYVMDRAADAALAIPGIRAVVLNIGGDLVVRGNWTEAVAIANPRAATENDRPLAQLLVQNRAVATSGDYRRGVQIGVDWFSHIVDPRTAEPARQVISATVVHPDAVTAGALATAFNILSPAESEQLATTLPGTDYLIVATNGSDTQHHTSPGWAQLHQPETTSTATSSDNTTARLLSISAQRDKLWDPKQELVISLELSRFEGRYHSPFVAVWVEDQNHVPVRQLALWYNKPRWLPELRAWNDQQRNGGVNPASVSGATRSPGTYTLKWDGKDDKGEYVKQGKYTVFIEAAREHGTYQLIRQEMDFNGKFKQQPLNGNVEIASAALDYRQTSDAH